MTYFNSTRDKLIIRFHNKTLNDEKSRNNLNCTRIIHQILSFKNPLIRYPNTTNSTYSIDNNRILNKIENSIDAILSP